MSPIERAIQKANNILERCVHLRTRAGRREKWQDILPRFEKWKYGAPAPKVDIEIYNFRVEGDHYSYNMRERYVMPPPSYQKRAE